MILAMNDVDKALFCSLLDFHRTQRFRGIKKIVDGKILAMIGYDEWTFNSVQIHVWTSGKHALSKQFIREGFSYPFVQCGKGIVIGVTPCNNVAALELNRKLGFRVVHTIKDGYALGTDLAIQEMRREECRWLKERKVPNGKKLSSSIS